MVPIAGWWKNVQAAVKTSVCRETPGCSPGHAFAECWAYRASTCTLYMLSFHYLSRLVAGSGCIHYPHTHSACKSSTHRQKFYPLPLSLRGSNQGKWGMPPAPTSFMAQGCGLGMKECQATLCHVMCCALVWYAYPLCCYGLIYVVHQRLLGL